MKKTVWTAAGVAAIVACAVAAAFFLFSRGEDQAVVDRAMAEARALPLVGLVLDDVPGAEARLRASLQDELRDPTTQGPPRPLALMGELRTAHVVPALRATATADARAILAARLALMRHLKGVDIDACRQLALIGIQRADKLDPTGQRLMRDMLAAMEKAYRSGRAAIASGNAPATLSDVEAGALLSQAGFDETDFDRLQNLARLSAPEACDLAIRLNEAPGKLPEDKGGGLARYLAAAQ